MSSASCRAPKGYPYGLFDVRFVPTADDVLVAGWVADRYASVKIEFADGSREVIKPQAGFLLAELPAKQLVRGHEATTIVGRDAAGKELPPRIPVGEAFSRRRASRRSRTRPALKRSAREQCESSEGPSPALVGVETV